MEEHSPHQSKTKSHKKKRHSSSHENNTKSHKKKKSTSPHESKTKSHKKTKKMYDAEVQTVIKTRDFGVQVDFITTGVHDFEGIKDFLRKQCRLPKEKRDNEMFRKASKILYQNRRAFIMSSFPMVKIVKETHPYLFNLEQIFTEFGLIAQEENLYSKYEKNVARYSSYICQTVPSCPHKRKINSEMQAATDEIEEKWIEMAGSLYLLPNYMGESRITMLRFEKEFVEDPKLPYIKCHGDIRTCLKREAYFEVIVEKITVCEPANILEAIFGLLSVYYIFNMVYPESCKKTLVVLEKLYVEFSDNAVQLSESDEQLIQLLEKHSPKE